MDPTSSHDSERGARSKSRKSSNQPMQFMFIDSSDHGVNAKPDKAVRSFVMKSARNQKPWSTRQKTTQSPTGKSGGDTRVWPRPSPSHTRSGSQSHSRTDRHRAPGPITWQESDGSPSLWNEQSIGSPISRSGSIYSIPSANWLLSDPNSSHASTCNIPDCTGEFCPHMRQRQSALTRRDGFDISFAKSLDCLIVRLDPNSEGLVEQFQDFLPHMVPMDIHNTSAQSVSIWVRNSIQNAASAPFIYTMLTSAAKRTNIPSEWFKHRAIEEVNKLLADADNSVADSMIASVLMLLNIEETNLADELRMGLERQWSEEAHRAHYSGLSAMIQRRGGLAGLSSNRCLQLFLLMHSTAIAVSAFERPYATLVDANGETHGYDIPSFRPRPSSGRILRQFRDLKLDPVLLDIISDIIVFVGDLSSWYEGQTWPLDPIELQKNGCLLMYRLFDWNKKAEEAEAKGDTYDIDPLDRAVSLALLIFVCRISEHNEFLPHDLGLGPRIYKTVCRLRATLEKVSVFRWGKSQDVLLWTLTMGALGAQKSPEFAFFMQYCKITFPDLGFNEKTNAEELLDRMKKGLWIGLLLDKEVKKVWAMMGLCKGEEVDDASEDEVSSPPVNDEHAIGHSTTMRFFTKKKSSSNKSSPSSSST